MLLKKQKEDHIVNFDNQLKEVLENNIKVGNMEHFNFLRIVVIVLKDYFELTQVVNVVLDIQVDKVYGNIDEENYVIVLKILEEDGDLLVV